jgi:hypothetical protein
MIRNRACPLWVVSSTGHCNTARRSSPVWRWSNSSIESQDLRHRFRSSSARATSATHWPLLPAPPELSLLLRREPCPCIRFHMHIVPTGQIRRESKADIPACSAHVQQTSFSTVAMSALCQKRKSPLIGLCPSHSIPNHKVPTCLSYAHRNATAGGGATGHLTRSDPRPLSPARRHGRAMNFALDRQPNGCIL